MNVKNVFALTLMPIFLLNRVEIVVSVSVVMKIVKQLEHKQVEMKMDTLMGTKTHRVDSTFYTVFGLDPFRYQPNFCYCPKLCLLGKKHF